MAIKVKELKDDAIVNVAVNKNFYMMVKNSLYYLFMLEKDPKVKEESLKKIKEASYEQLNDYERTFYCLSLLVAEIERVASTEKLYEEKEILEPGDEGYEKPKQD
jgi:hypothetical protein